MRKQVERVTEIKNIWQKFRDPRTESSLPSIFPCLWGWVVVQNPRIKALKVGPASALLWRNDFWAPDPLTHRLPSCADPAGMDP